VADVPSGAADVPSGAADVPSGPKRSAAAASAAADEEEHDLEEYKAEDEEEDDDEEEEEEEEEEDEEMAEEEEREGVKEPEGKAKYKEWVEYWERIGEIALANDGRTLNDWVDTKLAQAKNDLREYANREIADQTLCDAFLRNAEMQSGKPKPEWPPKYIKAFIDYRTLVSQTKKTRATEFGKLKRKAERKRKNRSSAMRSSPARQAAAARQTLPELFARSSPQRGAGTAAPSSHRTSPNLFGATSSRVQQSLDFARDSGSASRHPRRAHGEPEPHEAMDIDLTEETATPPAAGVPPAAGAGERPAVGKGEDRKSTKRVFAPAAGPNDDEMRAQALAAELAARRQQAARLPAGSTAPLTMTTTHSLLSPVQEAIRRVMSETQSASLASLTGADPGDPRRKKWNAELLPLQAPPLHSDIVRWRTTTLTWFAAPQTHPRFTKQEQAMQITLIMERRANGSNGNILITPDLYCLLLNRSVNSQSHRRTQRID
jgi:hypothetical protein